jgi:hypothetical protein
VSNPNAERMYRTRKLVDECRRSESRTWCRPINGCGWFVSVSKKE